MLLYILVGCSIFPTAITHPLYEDLLNSVPNFQYPLEILSEVANYNNNNNNQRQARCRQTNIEQCSSQLDVQKKRNKLLMMEVLRLQLQLNTLINTSSNNEIMVPPSTPLDTIDIVEIGWIQSECISLLSKINESKAQNEMKEKEIYENKDEEIKEMADNENGETKKIDENKNENEKGKNEELNEIGGNEEITEKSENEKTKEEDQHKNEGEKEKNDEKQEVTTKRKKTKKRKKKNKKKEKVDDDNNKNENDEDGEYYEYYDYYYNDYHYYDNEYADVGSLFASLINYLF